ncbi:cupin domain-containing protein [bacterium]|nr:cupin domain-containing protein [bacterium]
MAGGAVATVQIDNERTNVTEWSLPPGGSTGLHRHQRDYVVVPQTSGHLTLMLPNGERTVAGVTAGQAYYRSAGAEHNVFNEGESTVVFVEIEIK